MNIVKKFLDVQQNFQSDILPPQLGTLCIHLFEKFCWFGVDEHEIKSRRIDIRDFAIIPGCSKEEYEAVLHVREVIRVYIGQLLNKELFIEKSSIGVYNDQTNELYEIVADILVSKDISIQLVLTTNKKLSETCGNKQEVIVYNFED